MKKYIGIIAAMEEEMLEIRNHMQDIQMKNIYELECIQGKIRQKEIVLVRCGVGKVNAARVTQLLIDYYPISYMINIGSAGAISSELKPGDLVIGKSLVQCDFDISVFQHKKGYIPEIGDEIVNNTQLLQKCGKLVQQIQLESKYRLKIGKIASADFFCTQVEDKKRIQEEFEADCIEMEGAAIAQVCHLDKIDFIIIRGISDVPGDNNEIEHENYLSLASKRAADIAIKLIEH